MFPLLLLALDLEFVRCQGTAHGPRLLLPQVLGLEGLSAVKLAQIIFLCLVDHGEDTGNRLAHSVAVKTEKKTTNV